MSEIQEKRFYCTFIPPRVRVRVTVKLSAVFFFMMSHQITMGGTKVQLALKNMNKNIPIHTLFTYSICVSCPIFLTCTRCIVCENSDIQFLRTELHYN